MISGFQRRALVALLAAGAFAAAGCSGAGDSTGRGRTVVISTAGDADHFFTPTHVQLQALAVTDLLFEKLAEIGPKMNTLGDRGREPRLARSWDWASDSMSVTFHLDPRARWHDGVPVRARDVSFAFSIYTDPKVGSSRGADMLDVVDSITVQDSLTCTAWFRRRSPERFHILTYNLKPLPEHILGSMAPDSIETSAFARAPVGNGPFRFVRWVPRQQIEVAAVDSFYRGRPSVDRVIWSIVKENNVAVQRVMTGESDFIERVGAEDARSAAANPDLQVVEAGSMSYGYVIFNLRDGDSDSPHPIFGEREVRRALTRAVDRKALVANVFDTLGRVSLGPFVRLQWSADTTLRQIAFDRAAAIRTLDSLGWREGDDGIRERGGRELAFTIISPASSTARQRAAVVLQEQWRLVGARVTAEVLDNKAWLDQSRAHRFDATMMMLNADPSPSGIRQSWTAEGATIASGFNVGRYSNMLVDRDLDAAATTAVIDSARAHYRQAYQTLLDDAPAIWIFEPLIVALANRRLDLGTLRPDAWWSSIPSWRVTSDDGTR
jgi:peptide/nickel transport system substrate-binding protein